MNSVKMQNKNDRICAGTDCNNVGKYLLRIIYLNKEGWFCESSKDYLVTNGLILEKSNQEIVQSSTVQLLSSQE
jgi:hypothetical protein